VNFPLNALSPFALDLTDQNYSYPPEPNPMISSSLILSRKITRQGTTITLNERVILSVLVDTVIIMIIIIIIGK